LDEGRFEEWLRLLAPELHYWMPAQSNRYKRERERSVGGPDELPYFEETWDHMRQRVARLRTGTAWAEEPPSRTRRLVTNLRVSPQPEGCVRARTNLLLYRTRNENRVQTFVASREDRLRHDGAGWLISARKIVLDATTIPAHNLSVFF
jgi:3-phenylpropionate/cinnamic acid dioxygenase small subunit